MRVYSSTQKIRDRSLPNFFNGAVVCLEHWKTETRKKSIELKVSQKFEFFAYYETRLLCHAVLQLKINDVFRWFDSRLWNKFLIDPKLVCFFFSPLNSGSKQHIVQVLSLRYQSYIFDVADKRARRTARRTTWRQA